MTVIGLDDTDSRELGMCTTYVASRIAARVREEAGVERLLLVRLNPAVEHKTRGNAALAVHTDLDADRAFALARAVLDETAQTDDPDTHPGLVVAPDDPADVAETVGGFAGSAVRDHLTVETARSIADEASYRQAGWKDGRGVVGALAAVGAWRAVEEWTAECISYRHPDRWGTPREVDSESVFAAADAGYPTVWDTVDRGEGETVCVPHTPGPVLYGIRGENPAACREVAAAVESEPVARRETCLTNQGTDAHLRDESLADVEDGRSYRVTGTVSTGPETREGGHVFFDLRDWHAQLQCVAFEPTKRFRDRVRGLRPGDEITACGEVSDGTLKLEKFAVRELVTTEGVPPKCPGCDRRMKSAGRDQGYRCRDCGTSAAETVERELDRTLERGWYEVPPCARRHIAKPLVRGGFDAPTHPER